MSVLPNAEANDQHAYETGQNQATSPSAADVSASLTKFWDTVRSSAELIVTLRQEVVQLRAQNATLETALAAAQDEALHGSASSSTIEHLELQIEELQMKLEESRQQHQLDVEKASQHAQATTEQLEKLQADLSQARVELCEYEMQISTKDAELQKLGEQLAYMQERCEELAVLVSEARAENQQTLGQTQNSVVELQAQNALLEQRLTDATLDGAELRSTMDRMKIEKSQLNDDYLLLAEKYQSIEVQVASLQKALADAQDELLQATTQVQQIVGEPTSLELEALQHRLSELEHIAAKAVDSETAMQSLQEEIEDLQEQLGKALGIVELYRAAGLRHVEDPDLRNQMSLFHAADASTESLEIMQEQASGKGLTPEEMEALAVKLDNLASRVAQLLGIS